MVDNNGCCIECPASFLLKNDRTRKARQSPGSSIKKTLHLANRLRQSLCFPCERVAATPENDYHLFLDFSSRNALTCLTLGYNIRADALKPAHEDFQSLVLQDMLIL